jgi:predicted dehydrogenase
MKSVEEFSELRWDNTACGTPDARDRNVAIIGCGNYAFSTIAYYLKARNRRFLRAAFDIKTSRALSLCKAYGGAYAVGDWREILADPQVRMVFIASNHASHAAYAMACIEAGKHVHIEKPHVVSVEQLDRLVAAMRQNPGSKVFLGFNRPKSRLLKHLHELLATQSGPLMINWAIVGHEIPDGHWYYDEKEGGRVLGNLCHWTDLTLHQVSLERAFPCEVVPANPAGERSNCVVSLVFADRSCATITFSAKAHTFEGVREALNLTKGHIVANLTDFQTLTVDIAERKKRVHLRHRDHGHRANILNSLAGATDDSVPGENISYVAATARFFLTIRQAIDRRETTIVSSEDIFGAPA